MKKRIAKMLMITAALGMLGMAACGPAGQPQDTTTADTTAAIATQAATTAEVTTTQPPQPEYQRLEAAGNLLKITTQADFDAGICENLAFEGTVGNGALVLEDGQLEGAFTSAIYTGVDFEYLVASWNADVPPGAWVEIRGRALVKANPADTGEAGEWSKWLSWGKWGPSVKRASTTDRDSLAFMSTDEFSIFGSAGGTEIQLMAVLCRDSADIPSPVLRQVAATWQNTNEGREVVPVYAQEAVQPAEAVRLSTPAYAQMNRDPSIANSICSPLTASVLLNDRVSGLDLLPEEVALIAQDFNYGFGNWAYTMATAGAYGFEAYVQFASFDIVMQELTKGNSVGMAVRYTTDPKDKSLPYLENGAISSTNGHLITITGYFWQDGELYFYSSDSAGSEDFTSSGADRVYKASQLEKAWGQKRTTYIIPSGVPEEGVTVYSSQRIPATLEHLGDKEYALMADGQRVEVPKDFTLQKTSVMGRGTMAFTVEGQEIAMPDPVKAVSANNVFYYNVRATDNGTITIDTGKAKIDTGKEKLNITVYVFTNDGKTYITQPIEVE